MEWRTHDPFGYYYPGYPMYIIWLDRKVSYGDTIFNPSLFVLAAVQGGP